MKYGVLLIVLFSFISCNSLKYNIKTENFAFSSFYNQFYILDKNANLESENFNFSDGDIEAMLYKLPEGLVVFTRTEGNVKGKINVFNDKPSLKNISNFDHIVEGDIEINSGELHIYSWGNFQPEKILKVDKGNYRIRILGSNFNSVKETDMQQESDNDYYEIQIWKSDEKGIKIIKKYQTK